MPSENLLIILGATASGKTKLAVSIADELNAEIISADSRQIFKGMDIGTGKDLAEYKIGESQIPYHLIDIVNAGEKYNVNVFKEDFYQALTTITQKNKLPVLCGGTGMYIHALLQNHELTAIPKNEELREKYRELDQIQLQNILKQYPKEHTAHVDLSSVKRLTRAIEIAAYLKDHKLKPVVRPTLNPLVIGLQSDVEIRRDRIIKRLNYRLDNGLIEEVETLISNGVDPAVLTFYGLEYKFMVSYLQNEFDLAFLREKLSIAICQFAKRQMTFFRKMEKDGVKINWLNTDQDFELLKSTSIRLIDANFKK
ncbi:tRNA (adenosine(37)-N6)-dimethylallyltransferase MiaA [Pedobacter cryotolerans]|uniref:tRNA dimethylallyltransferase n=1 Tax=Pedobacter cryotolerans TaxID=2571270 RepID=A0A4U1C9M7_9SPHI|nr:tRNA (adenosine(37)-N6)-dimethylallyltransferase MiaA [Pedobacter cryotolerans]TKC02475.1 tRNA (adenosine(37)-N6)-dimethylallyltransferase MiaA [Pedobacter cryotolerans]